MTQLLGFGLSTLVLAAVSLVAIPSMIRASGTEAIASILTGQAIGAVAAVLTYYGWGITGPAAIARGDRRERMAEYLESVRVRLVMAVPLTITAAAISASVNSDHPLLGALGAIAAASIGLTPSWYFVGLRKPYALLILDTSPRAIGTLIGITFMGRGYGAEAGLLGQWAGVIAGVLFSSTWVLLAGSRPSGWADSQPGVLAALRSRWRGVLASAIPAVYGAIPLITVGYLAPASQPAFAVLDKLGKQIIAALSPLVAVLQGWVPGTTVVGLRARIRLALLVTTLAAIALAVGFALLGERAIQWLSSDEIPVPEMAIALMGLALGATLLGAVVSRACLVPLDKLNFVVVISAAGALAGIVLIVILLPLWGLVGAVAGLLVGALTKTILGLFGLRAAVLDPELAQD